MDVVTLLVQLISGAVGGNIAGSLLKKLSLGPVGNSIVGVLGGGLGGVLLNALGVGAGAGGVDAGSVIGSIAGGGIGGGVLLAIVGGHQERHGQIRLKTPQRPETATRAAPARSTVARRSRTTRSARSARCSRACARVCAAPCSGDIVTTRTVRRSLKIRHHAKWIGGAPSRTRPRSVSDSIVYGLMNSSVALGIVGVASSMLRTKASRSASSWAS